ncbi:ATP synthase F1 subunit delta [Mangrovimonas aestuarii]|uniref:ATP synthase F1 subunit delta n=1 Tax=Mangrovimonas aestuarii TaxID=3018443 RepID=UPI0023787692|nr:ATP synthase F1 subunit delta [Mangrovimonas aestuarii]
MAGVRAAVRYAKAVLDLAQEKQVAEAVNNDMVSITKTVEASTELQQVLQNAVINPEAKKAALLGIFTDLNAVTAGLIDTLISNKRLNIIYAVANKYIELYKVAQGIEVAHVTTAVPLTEELKTKVLDKVKTLTNSTKIELESTVDADIIGGFVLRVGDKQYNASIANQLQTLKRQLTLN